MLTASHWYSPKAVHLAVTQMELKIPQYNYWRNVITDSLPPLPPIISIELPRRKIAFLMFCSWLGFSFAGGRTLPRALCYSYLSDMFKNREDSKSENWSIISTSLCGWISLSSECCLALYWCTCHSCSDGQTVICFQHFLRTGAGGWVGIRGWMTADCITVSGGLRCPRQARHCHSSLTCQVWLAGPSVSNQSCGVSNCTTPPSLTSHLQNLWITETGCLSSLSLAVESGGVNTICQSIIHRLPAWNMRRVDILAFFLTFLSKFA